MRRSVGAETVDEAARWGVEVEHADRAGVGIAEAVLRLRTVQHRSDQTHVLPAGWVEPGVAAAGLHRGQGGRKPCLEGNHPHKYGAYRTFTFFGGKPKDLFAWLCERLPLPARPARRPKAA